MHWINSIYDWNEPQAKIFSPPFQGKDLTHKHGTKSLLNQPNGYPMLMLITYWERCHQGPCRMIVPNVSGLKGLLTSPSIQCVFPIYTKKVLNLSFIASFHCEMCLIILEYMLGFFSVSFVTHLQQIHCTANHLQHVFDHTCRSCLNIIGTDRQTEPQRSP